MEFLWHDYETFGVNPAVDRPCQFAAQRTDADLKPVGDPITLYCAPADDVLPRPGACLVTGITPRIAKREGIVETEFASEIRDLMILPGTCSVGYNSIRFDDEVSRNLYYRNLFDPYEREWKNGNSRWDLIDLARMCYALRPDGIEWPHADSSSSDSSTRPSFRLEDLTSVNGIGHEDAHDALSDVHATIELARLIKSAQPRLFEWSLSMRNKNKARDLLDLQNPTPVVHTSGKIHSKRGCTTLVLPLAQDPQNDKAVIVFDLMGDAKGLIDSNAEDIRDRVFTRSKDLPEGVDRLPLKKIKWNAVPMLAPAVVLGGVDQNRIGLDADLCNENADLILENIHSVRRAVEQAFFIDSGGEKRDPDLAIYSGGFFSDTDRHKMRRIHESSPRELAVTEWEFDDPRLPLMLLRYRARNWPDSLSASDWEAWQADRRMRLTQPPGAEFYGFERFRQDLERSRTERQDEAKSQRILDELEDWAEELALNADISDL